MSWLERIFRRRQLYDELDEEVREHLEEKTERLMRMENLSRAEARQAALRAFGNPTLVQTRSREVWQWPRFEFLLADMKLALRRLRNEIAPVDASLIYRDQPRAPVTTLDLSGN